MLPRVKLEDHVLGRRAGHPDQVSDAEVGQAIQDLLRLTASLFVISPSSAISTAILRQLQLYVCRFWFAAYTAYAFRL